MDDNKKQELEKQQYRLVGSHSAVKVCGWTKNMIRGKGGCYKMKFYGIMSHQCLQMTTCLSCANRCVFCWRGHKEPVSKVWKGAVDDPSMIVDESIKSHIDLLQGFKGGLNANKKILSEMKDVKHVALSLTGEPILYPKLNELLALFNKRGISTFIVTNGQYPEQIKSMDKVTQFYISLDAPSKDLLKKVDVPLFSDYWERLLESLKIMSERNDRTCLRLTLVKDMNIVDPKGYSELIKLGDPDFVEVKGYMFVGQSRQRLKESNMPLHEEVVEFSKELLKHLPDYDIVSEHIPSRVVLLGKKKFFKRGKWSTWIDFGKWNEFVNSGKDFSKEDYALPTPETGLSGKGTLDYWKFD